MADLAGNGDTIMASVAELLAAYDTLRWFGERPEAMKMLQQRQMDRANQGFNDLRLWDPKYKEAAREGFPPVNPFNPIEPMASPAREGDRRLDWRDWQLEK